MSIIPPNIGLVGALAQTQVAAKDSAKIQDSQRNQRMNVAKETKKLAQQRQEEVTDAQDVEDLFVNRSLYGETGGNAHDRYEPSDVEEGNSEQPLVEENREDGIFSQVKLTNTDLPEEARDINHIDLSA